MKKMIDDIIELKLAWLGGIIDGEGNVGIEKNVRINGFILSPRVVITNTDENLINEVKKIYKTIGLNYFCQKRKRIQKDGYKRKICHDLQVHRISEVYLLLSLVKKYLISKRKRVDLMIKFCKSRIDRIMLVNKNANAPYNSFELDISDKLHVLNKR